MSKVLFINPEACTGCLTCEVVCSLSHGDNCTPSLSRIRVIRHEGLGLYFPMTCLHCAHPVCEKGCSWNALYRHEGTGAILVDSQRCIGCRMCLLLCPWGGLSLDYAGKILKCDLCGGTPQCVEHCHDGAIEFISQEEAERKLQQAEGGKATSPALDRAAPETDLARRAGAKWRSWKG